LNCDVPEEWQLVHCVFTLIAPVCQFGVVWPPWQLTFEQVSAEELKEAAPVFALYVAKNATSPGGTLPPAPGRPLARL
jgi:hypothetical protein